MPRKIGTVTDLMAHAINYALKKTSIIDKSAFEKYKGRGTKYKLKVPRASGSPEYAEAEPKGNFQLYIVICPLYIPTNSDLSLCLMMPMRNLYPLIMLAGSGAYVYQQI